MCMAVKLEHKRDINQFILVLVHILGSLVFMRILGIGNGEGEKRTSGCVYEHGLA